MFITPYNKDIVRDKYFEVSYEDTKNAYVVMEMDVNSTPGVEYVTVDPSYIRAQSADSDNTQSAADFWLGGGGN